MELEFRVFLPIIRDVDSSWIEQTQREQYTHRINTLMSKFQNSTSIEERTDNYIIPHDHSYGLKYRSGTKLELKVMNERHPTELLEQWTKTKYGKKGLKHHLHKIVNQIKESALSTNSDFSHFQLDQPPSIEIAKRRNKRMIQMSNVSIVEELCHLSTKSLNPHYINQIQREWLSVAVEGTRNEIMAYLNSFESTSLWELCNLAMNICNNTEADYSLARTNKFLPVIAGYPKFILLVENKLSDQEYRESINEMQLFLNNLTWHTV